MQNWIILNIMRKKFVLCGRIDIDPARQILLLHSVLPVFMRNIETLLLWLGILGGITLRCIDISVPDVLTDEAQFGLGTSAAHPPLGMAFFRAALMMGGSNILALRSVSIVLGILFLPLLYLLVREWMDRRGALLVTALGSLFPSAILFSRLAFLSMTQLFFWTLFVLLFLRVKNNGSEKEKIALFLAAVASSSIKFQGFVIPFLFLAGRMMEKRGSVLRDDVSWILLLSLVPIALYDLTHPGVLASVLLYGGSADVLGLIDRFRELFSVWWNILGFAVLLLPLSLLGCTRLRWEMHVFLGWVLLQGFLFGPSHEYYVTDLVLFVIPIAMLIARSQVSSIVVLPLMMMNAILLLGPSFLVRSSWTNPLYQQEGYWNLHAEEINNVLKDQDHVIVLGDAGHQLRWYMNPETLVGKDMDLSAQTGAFLLLDPSIAVPFADGKKLYNDEQTRIIVR
jgi:hypothetical protein